MSAFQARRPRPDRVGHDRGVRIASACGHAAADWRPSASSSATASGFSCSATSSCSPPSSRPTRCWSGNTAGGPSGRDLFNLRNVAMETACLLLSSFTCGLASIGARTRNGLWFYGAMAATFVLGAAFLGIEMHEFAGMVARGAGPTRSAFLSAFFTLVGCHGLHVTAGLLWLLTMMAQVFAKGYRRRYPAAYALLQPVLAYAGHHLGRVVYGGVSDGSWAMSHAEQASGPSRRYRAG